MDFIKLTLSPDGHYQYKEASNIAMNIVGNFFSSDVRTGKQRYPTFKDWALDDSFGMGTGGNITFLEKEGDYVYLTDAYSLEDVPTEVKMTRAQFARLFDEWQAKVCAALPKEVIIKYEEDHFLIETRN